MATGLLYSYSARPHGTRVAGMATGPGHIAPGWLGWLQVLATNYQGGLDGNRVWPHGTREAEMATGHGHISQGNWDGNRVWPHGTRKAGIATRSGHIAPGRLGWQHGLAT